MNDIDRVVPFDLWAESCILGCVLMFPDAAQAVDEAGITSAHFHRPAHSMIFDGIAEMERNGIVTDLVNSKTYFTDHNQLESIGGIAYLVELADGTPGLAGLKNYCETVKEAHNRRQMIVLGRNLVTSAYEDTVESSTDLITAAQSALFDIQGQSTKGAFTAHTAAQEALERIYQRHDPERDSDLIPLPCRALNRAIGGVGEGEIFVIGGGTGTGKTSLALGWATDFAKRGLAGSFFSGEMSEEELAARVMHSESLIPSLKNRQGIMTPDEIARIEQTAHAMKDYKLSFTSRSMTLSQIKAKCQFDRRRFGRLDYVFVDYLGRMAPEDPRHKKIEWMSAMMVGLKSMAQEMRTRVFVLSQFNRSAAKSLEHPSMHELKETGDIENEADAVLLLDRADVEAVASPHKYQGPTRIESFVQLLTYGKLDKARNGAVTLWSDYPGVDPADTIRFSFLPQCTRVDDFMPVYTTPY